MFAMMKCIFDELACGSWDRSGTYLSLKVSKWGRSVMPNECLNDRQYVWNNCMVFAGLVVGLSFGIHVVSSGATYAYTR